MITRESNYKNFGRVLEIENDNLLLKITLDVGPRIIYYGTKDYNIFYEDIDKKTSLSNTALETIYGKGAKWCLLGGHRLWKSPEDIKSYTPDCKSNVTIDNNLIKVSCPEDKATGLIKEIELEIIENNKVRVLHRLTNNREEQIEVAAWALSVLRPQGTLIIPLNNNDKGFLPARNLVYWSYSDYEDVRFVIDNDFAYLEQRQDMDDAFKIGLFLEKGVVGYWVDDVLYTKTFDVDKTANYPDFNCNFESYTNSDFIECESISGLERLAIGDIIEHTEVWDYTQGVANLNDEAIKKLIEKKI